MSAPSTTTSRAIEERNRLRGQLATLKQDLDWTREKLKGAHRDIVTLKMVLFQTKTNLEHSEQARERAMQTTANFEAELHKAEVVIALARTLTRVPNGASEQDWTDAFDALAQALSTYGPFSDED